jgi:hypothetical protein
MRMRANAALTHAYDETHADGQRDVRHRGSEPLPGWIRGGSLAIRVALTEERGFPFVRAFFSGTRPRGRQHASGFIQHRLATVELLFVVANRLDRFRVSAGERFGDLLGRESVVARQRLAATHIAQLVEHDGPGFVSALIALNRGQLDLREPRELPGDLLLLEPVVAGDGQLVLVRRARCGLGATPGTSRAAIA